MFTVKVKRKRTKALDRITKALQGKDQAVAGFIAGKVSQDVVLRAVINEFGSDNGHVPERPFMRNAIRSNMGKYRRMFAEGAKAMIAGRSSKDAVLAEIGREAANDIRKEIASLSSPANAAETVRTKGKNDPLTETGGMGDSVSSEVR